MDDSWHYILNRVCPDCGGRLKSYFDYTKCEDCSWKEYNMGNFFVEIGKQQIETDNLICPICNGKMKYYNFSDQAWCQDCTYLIRHVKGTKIDRRDFKHNKEDKLAYGKINVPDDLDAHTIIIDNCELIKLYHKELDINFKFDTKKLENIDVIEINGHRFVREK